MIIAWDKNAWIYSVSAAFIFAMLAWGSRLLSESREIEAESARFVELAVEHGSQIERSTDAGPADRATPDAGALSRFQTMLDKYGALSRSMSSEQRDSGLSVSSSFRIRFRSLHELLRSIHRSEQSWRVTHVSIRSERSDRAQSDGMILVDLEFHELEIAAKRGAVQ